MHSSVREKAFVTLSCTLLPLIVKIFKKKTIGAICFPKCYENQLKLIFQRNVSSDLERAPTSELCQIILKKSNQSNNSFCLTTLAKSELYSKSP